MKKFGIGMVFLIGIFTVCTSCLVYINTVIGNGVMKTSERTVSSFEKIHITGSAEVRFYKAEEIKVVVTVDSNLDEYVDIVTKNHVLEIGSKKGSYSFTKYLVEVYSPVLTGVSVSGSGSFTGYDILTASTFEAAISGSGNFSGTIENEVFTAKISGSGRITVLGNAGESNINISGSGRFIGNDFCVKKAAVNVSGSGNARVYVTDRLDATISGSGRIEYSGNPPTVNSKITGSGRINKL